jgi:dipeptidyl aminopeptidase/acylaminoacyl peptidase
MEHIPATLEILQNWRFLNDIQITSDGGRVAFTVWERVPGSQKRRWQIWVSATGGQEARPFLSGKADETCPRWSPDGKFLAFLTRPEGEKEQPQLHLVEAEGGTPRVLCSMPTGVIDLAWAPDGSQIAFTSLEGNEAATDPKVLGPARQRRLWTLRPDQAIPRPVTPDNLSVWEYAWSPDSTQLALYYSNGGDINDWYRSHIGVVPATGGGVRKIVHLTWEARVLAWSPDGTQLAYLSGQWSDPLRGSGDIFAVTLENGEIRNLTPGLGSSPTWLCWLNDGRHLLYTAIHQVTHQVGLLDSTTGTVTILEDDFTMQGDQPALAITPDRRHVATVHSNSQLPHEIYAGTLVSVSDLPQSIEWQPLTRLNALLSETLDLAHTERITYQSVDDWTIYGLFTPPLHSETDKLPPLYVNVHGGPSGACCDTWFSGTHYFAAHGFAVFQPNMRGSWGQGADFANAVLGDMGGKDLQDILAGVEYLVSTGKVDGARICIGGWSNGGFLSACAITQSQRFRAAMVGAGITDWHNMHAQSNIPDSDVMLMGGNPLDHPEIYRQRSPITHASQINTPTLVLHGEDDPVVPVAQGYAFYRAVVERQVPAACNIYPREGHGVAEIDHANDSITRTLNWFQEHTR